MNNHERRLLSSIFLEDNQGQHFVGIFAGLGVHEEVFDEDLRSCGLWYVVIAVVSLH